MPLSPNIAAQYADGVAEAYRDAELDILRAIARSLAERIDTPDWQLKALARAQTVRQQVIGILARVDPIAASRMLADITAAYGAGQTAILGDLRGAYPALELAPTLQGQAAVIGLVEEARGAVGTAGQSMLRAVDDIYRDVTIKATASTLTGGSQKVAVQRALNTLAGKGLQAVTLQSGRKVGIGDYVTMAVRTATARAAFSGADETMGQAGIDLCRVLPGPRACDICDKWARKVLARTGAAGRRELTDVTNGRKFTITVDDTLAAAYRGGWGHPNAVLEGSTYASYGATQEMVRSRYSGPAVTLRTRLGETTIGANHPVMTQRGLVRAKLLREGDQLVYDRRAIEGAVAMMPEHHLGQVPLVEDVFQTFAGLGGLARVAATSNDLHGDAVFGEGEIEVVLPESGLLSVLDPGTPQDLGEFDLARADMEAELLTRLRAKDATAEWVYVAATSGMGGFGPHDYLLVPIESKRTVQFDGWAFDASTEGSLYCSDGIVVSNCRCSLEPYIPGVTKKTDLIERPKWDQAGYEAQQKQRGIERQIRAWKAREAVALDPADAASAKRQVRGYQQQMRDHLAANPDLKRQSGREQVNGSMTGNPKYARVIAR